MKQSKRWDGNSVLVSIAVSYVADYIKQRTCKINGVKIQWSCDLYFIVSLPPDVELVNKYSEGLCVEIIGSDAVD